MTEEEIKEAEEIFDAIKVFEKYSVFEGEDLFDLICNKAFICLTPAVSKEVSEMLAH